MQGPDNLQAGWGPWRADDVPAGFSRFPDAAVGASVSDRFFAMAEAFPDRKAISSPAGSWTYADLATEVRGVAAGLLDRLDADESAPVAVVADHDGPLVVAILAIIAAGQIVVVLDPSAPAPQTDEVLAACGASVVLHDRAHTDWVAERVPSGEGVASRTVVPLDEVAATAGDLPVRGSGSPLMLAFTSGTSGGPKAAVITHGVLMNLVRGATNALGIGPDDRMPMLFPTSLAVASYPMFLPLLNGGTLATLDVRSVGLAPVADFLETERITLAYMAPTVVRFLVDALAGRSFPELRMIALGGEIVDDEVLGLTNDLFGPTWLANGYGTTETGVVTLWVVPAELVGAGGLVAGAAPVGYAVPDVEISILDDLGEPVGQGVAGEIAVASPYLFDGYWGHPELNAKVLSDDLQGRDGWQLYRTGDYGKLDDHGALVVLGRLDTRVKVRGRPVVLGDVEASVQQLADVADAAVVAHTRDGIVELVAHVVVIQNDDGEPSADPQQLRAALLERHEAYRVPSRWVVLDELPRLPNGKVNRRGLPPVDDSRADVTPADDTSTTDAAPPAARTSTSTPPSDVAGARRQVLLIWELLLPGRTISIDDDFAELGGDSLLAAEMVLRIERELGVTLPMGDLVRARTVRAVADLVVERQGTTDAPSLATCVNPGDETTHPRLWFLPDLHGSAYRVRHLAEALGDDVPVWSFESPLLAGEPNPYTSLETFVARWLTDLRAAQPEGPYWLAGYSFGGICAYEMARQLVRDGAEVAFLGVVDVGPGYRGPGWHGSRSPFRPWFSVAKPPEAGASLSEQVRHYREMLRQGPRRTVRHFAVRSGLSRIVDPVRFRADIRTHGRVRQGWRLWYAWEEHWKLAARGWDRGATYPGRVHLFWGSDSASADATMGWGPLVGELRIERFPGDHMGILEPRGAAELAAVLRPALEDR